jgi:uncharacterized protein involved in exopolysaccharide biosynthesis
MNKQEFLPLHIVKNTFDSWWIVVLIMTVGGIGGWIFHFFQPPVYEATAVITANIDFQKRELTQYEEDHAFGAAAAILTSTGVKNQIVTEAQRNGISINVNQLQQQMFLERRQSVWELRIRNRDPEIAVKLVNWWAENADKALYVALEHAIGADQIRDQISSLIGRQSGSGSFGLNSEFRVTLSDLSNDYLQEQRLSLGLISIMKFAITGLATIPERPILYNLSNLVIAGAFIGFIVSLWVVNSHKVKRSV